MSRSGKLKYGRCRCQAMKLETGECVEGCPPPMGRRYHRAVGVKMDTDACYSIRVPAAAACKRLGLNLRWTSEGPVPVKGFVR